METEEQYRAALERLSNLMDADIDTPEGKELESLSEEISKYEDIHYPIPEPTQKEMFEFRMDQEGLLECLNNGIGIRLKKDGFTDTVIRRRHEGYEYLAYKDHCGGERWSQFPFDNAVIEKQILELSRCER